MEYFMRSQTLKITLRSIALSALFAASTASAGHYYEATTTTTMEGQRDTVMKVNSWVDADNARVYQPLAEPYMRDSQLLA